MSATATLLRHAGSAIEAFDAAWPAIRLLDEDFAAKIRTVGGHPFILVRLETIEGSGQHRYILCNTQNELSQFVEGLNRLVQSADLRLLRGLERALQAETYEAADVWFSWQREARPEAAEIVYLGVPDDMDLPDYYGYPIYEVRREESSDGPEQRLEILIELFEAYCSADGNDATRYRLAEALGLALSRCLGAREEYMRALGIVERALGLSASSIHLKAARHALTQKLEGKMVPDRLVKFIGEDNGYLKQFACPLPFERFEIGPAGDVLLCCGHWLPTSIGNFLRDPVDGILNSEKAQKIRASMTDGSYKYCNHLECAHMIQGTLPLAEELENPATRSAVSERNFRMESIDYLTFGFDQTCNLSCPSCRTHRIVEKASASTEKARAVEEKLVGLLPQVKTLHINPAGEMLASKPSRKLLELINDERCPDLHLDIISNGTLFSEEEWNKFPGIHNKVRSIRISIDAARKDTFEKLRRLGRYEPFLDNMRFLSWLRATETVAQLKFSFTYQSENFREMPEFVDFCVSMNCDFAIFERLQNICFSANEFRSKAVHLSDHPLHSEFLAVVRNPIFGNPRVWHDFDYEGAAKLTSDEARKRFVDAVATLPGAVTTRPNA